MQKVVSKLEDYDNKYFTGDVKDFPLVRIRFKGKQASDKEFEEYMTYINTIYGQEKAFVMLTDSSKGHYMASKHRIAFGNWTKENHDTIKQYCGGIAFLMSSVMMKTMLRAIFLIQKPPYEYIIVNDEEKAVEWLQNQIEKS